LKEIEKKKSKAIMSGWKYFGDIMVYGQTSMLFNQFGYNHSEGIIGLWGVIASVVSLSTLPRLT
jgi:hypothetical protein